jgi:hypothetical protein
MAPRSGYPQYQVINDLGGHSAVADLLCVDRRVVHYWDTRSVRNRQGVSFPEAVNPPEGARPGTSRWFSLSEARAWFDGGAPRGGHYKPRQSRES